MDDYNERITAYTLTNVRTLKEHNVEVYFEKENIYTMRKRGIISDKDYEKIRTVIAEKYGISLSSIFFL